MMNFIMFIIAMMDMAIGFRLISKKTTRKGVEKAVFRFVGLFILLWSLLVLFGLLIMCKLMGGRYELWQAIIHAGWGVYGIVLIKLLK